MLSKKQIRTTLVLNRSLKRRWLEMKPTEAKEHPIEPLATIPEEIIYHIGKVYPHPDRDLTIALEKAADARNDAINELFSMLDKNPRLLLAEGDVTAPSGNLIQGVSIYEYFLGSGDLELAKRCEPYFHKFDGGDKEQQDQFNKYKPFLYGIEKQTPYDLYPIFRLLACASEDEVSALLNHNYQNPFLSMLRTDLLEFRSDHAPRTINKPSLHFNYATLLHAFDLLKSEGHRLSKKKIRFVWRLLLGFLIRRLPGIDRCAVAQGLYNMRLVTTCFGEQFKRSYRFNHHQIIVTKSTEFPTTLTDTNLIDGLGGQFMVDNLGSLERHLKKNSVATEAAAWKEYIKNKFAVYRPEISYALEYAADARKDNIVELFAMLDNNPSLLMERSDVITPGGDWVQDVTIYEYLLGSGDFELAKRCEPYFLACENGEKEKQDQFNKYKPFIFEYEKQIPYDLNPIINILASASWEDVKELLRDYHGHVSFLRDALIEFRKHHAPRIINTPCLYFNYATLLHTFDLIIKNQANLSELKLLFAWRQLLGFLIRRLPGVDRCAAAQGLYHIRQYKMYGIGEAPERSYELDISMPNTPKAFPVTLKDTHLFGQLGCSYMIGYFGEWIIGDYQKAAFLSASLSASLVDHAAEWKDYINSKFELYRPDITLALWCAADGDRDKIDILFDMLEANPSLLLKRSSVIAPGGNCIQQVTIYEYLLGSGDFAHAKRCEPLFQRLENGEWEQQKQFTKYEPFISGKEQQIPYDLNCIFNLLDATPLNFIHTLLKHDSDKTQDYLVAQTLVTLIEFRKTYAPRVIEKPCLHFNYATLLHAFELLETKGEQLIENKYDYNNDKICFVWQLLIDFLVSRLPAVDRYSLFNDQHSLRLNKELYQFPQIQSKYRDKQIELPKTFRDKHLDGSSMIGSIGFWSQGKTLSKKDITTEYNTLKRFINEKFEVFRPSH